MNVQGPKVLPIILFKRCSCIEGSNASLEKSYGILLFPLLEFLNAPTRTRCEGDGQGKSWIRILQYMPKPAMTKKKKNYRTQRTIWNYSAMLCIRKIVVHAVQLHLPAISYGRSVADGDAEMGTPEGKRRRRTYKLGCEDADILTYKHSAPLRHPNITCMLRSRVLAWSWIVEVLGSEKEYQF